MTRQVADQLTFPDGVFIDRNGNIIVDYVNIDNALDSNEYEPLTNNLYRNKSGNIGSFHCYRCVQQGCERENSKFRDLGISNHFSHINNRHGCECEEYNSSNFNENRRNLILRYSLLKGTDTTKISGNGNYRLVCYLPMPDYILPEQRSDFKHQLRTSLLNSEFPILPLCESEDSILLPKHLTGLDNWLGDDECPYSMIGFVMCMPINENYVDFKFGEYEFRVSNSLRQDWQKDTLFFQNDESKGLLNQNHKVIGYKHLKPEIERNRILMKKRKIYRFPLAISIRKMLFLL